MPAAPEARDFPRKVRLLTGREYQWVFSDAGRVRGRHLTLLYRARANAGPARLGLAIGKRQARRAVDRNRIKRIVREAFRQRRARLAALDLVVLARAGAASCDRRRLRSEIESLLDRLP